MLTHSLIGSFIQSINFLLFSETPAHRRVQYIISAIEKNGKLHGNLNFVTTQFFHQGGKQASTNFGKTHILLFVVVGQGVGI